MTETTHRLIAGTAPLLISIPHLGRRLPPRIADGFAPVAQAVSDTDWHLDRLYGVCAPLGVSVLSAEISRYAIDLNRPPGGESLYPGQTTTGLCPRETFRGEPLYLPGREPGPQEVAQRLQDYWQPYHDALTAELARLHQTHEQVLLWEAHSICSVLPRLFDGKLADLNFGTNDGRSCDPALLAAVLDTPRTGDACFSRVVNGRFKGGYITRNYGQPAAGTHAIQLEMCQSTYMDETAPYAYRADRAEKIQPLLLEMLENGLAWLGQKNRAPVAR